MSFLPLTRPRRRLYRAGLCRHSVPRGQRHRRSHARRRRHRSDPGQALHLVAERRRPSPSSTTSCAALYYSKKLGDEIPSYGVYASGARVARGICRGRPRHIEASRNWYSRAVFGGRRIAPSPFGLQACRSTKRRAGLFRARRPQHSTDDQQIIAFFPARARALPRIRSDKAQSTASPFPRSPKWALITDLPLEGDLMAAMQGSADDPLSGSSISLKPLYDKSTICRHRDRRRPSDRSKSLDGRAIRRISAAEDALRRSTNTC